MVEQGEGLNIEKSVASRRKRRECDLYRKLKKAQDAGKTESKELSVQESCRGEWDPEPAGPCGLLHLSSVQWEGPEGFEG